MKFEDYWVSYLELSDGNTSLIDYQYGEVSKRTLRKIYKRFKGDGDVLQSRSLRAERFFSSKREMTEFFLSNP